MSCGVYSILHKDTGRCYVGSSVHIKRRLYVHRYLLDNKRHHSVKLQRSWNKYGPDAFETKILLYCDHQHRLMYEQIMIDGLKAESVGFNMNPIAGSGSQIKRRPEVVERLKQVQRASPRRKRYEWKGKFLCLAEICEQEGKLHKVVNRRVEDGWSLEDAINVPYNKYQMFFEGFGQRKTLAEWSKELGCGIFALRSRINKGHTIEQCFGMDKSITIHELADISGVNGKMVNARVKNGWSIGDALAYPKVVKGGHFFKERSKVST